MTKLISKKNTILLLIAVFAIISIFIYTKEKNTYDDFLVENIIEENQNEDIENVISKNNLSNSMKIKVHVIGEINNPGLYELEEGSRIDDLIFIAGGKTENANLNRVNLAYELEDGEQIYIPSIFDEDTEYNNKDNSSSKSSEKVNLNKASLEDLQTISGVGPSLAQKIITYRASIGKFKSVEDLKEISGIGDKKYESIKDFVCVK